MVILKNCKKVLLKIGKVIIIEYIMLWEIFEIDLVIKNLLFYDVGIMCVI